MPDTAALDVALRAVAPIRGVSIGNWADRATWRVDYAAGATAQQRAAAQAIIDGWDTGAAAEDDRAKDAAVGDIAAVALKEFFALRNEVRALKGLAALTPAQYRAYLKTLA